MFKIVSAHPQIGLLNHFKYCGKNVKHCYCLKSYYFNEENNIYYSQFYTVALEISDNVPLLFYNILHNQGL